MHTPRPAFSQSWVDLQDLYFNVCPSNSNVGGPQTTLGKTAHLALSFVFHIQDEETEALQRMTYSRFLS